MVDRQPAVVKSFQPLAECGPTLAAWVFNSTFAQTALPAIRHAAALAPEASAGRRGRRAGRTRTIQSAHCGMAL